ncbi:MAG: hypothetical protein IPL61_16040 [Myxococcales bacterium]|nr:hypothetical protein [Myxococcales bacterium]
MPRLAHNVPWFLAIAAAAACAGDPPPFQVDGGGGPDGTAGIDAAPSPTYRVSGKAKDYFTDAVLATVGIESDGMEPQLNATSDAAGDFAFDTVPPGSVFFLTASRAVYRPTRGVPVRVEAMPVTADQWLVSVNDARRQYTSLGLPVVTGKAVVFAELFRRNGTPLADVPVADITLLDALAAPVGSGPYVFGPNGDLVTNLTLAVTTVVNGRSRIGFLDVPPGSYTLSVTYTAGAGQPTTDTVRVDTFADGASLTRTGEGGGMGPGMGARTFTADVYPRLQTAANGGLGCANCHTTGGIAAILPFDLSVQLTLDGINARPGVLNLLAPAESMLLTKPMYEDPPNHPNATFLDATDPDYLVILQWIEQGATL